MTPEAKIAAQARAALIAGVVSIPLLGVVFGPGAILRAHVVRTMIERHGVGHAHLRRANLATGLGIAGTAIWLVAGVILLV